jgi:hypothetical protein
MALSTASMGDLAMVTPGPPWPMVAPVESPTLDGGALQGGTGVEVVGAGLWLGDDNGSLLQDLVMCGTSTGIPGSTTPGNAAPAPESSGVVDPGVSGLHLSGSPGILLLPINWRRVGDKVESACSRVTATKRLL